MFFKNARIFCSDFTFHNGSFEVTEDGLFGQILPEAVPADAVDLQITDIRAIGPDWRIIAKPRL